MTYYEMMIAKWMNLPAEPVLPLVGHWSVLEPRVGQASSGGCSCKCPRCGDVH